MWKNKLGNLLWKECVNIKENERASCFGPIIPQVKKFEGNDFNNKGILSKWNIILSLKMMFLKLF